MELRQLVYVEAVARCGGFTRAAEQLHVAQPAISAQVANLERELGTPLFTRTTRRVALTRAGELLVARARRILHELDDARNEIAAIRGVVTGDLRIGSAAVLGDLDLPRLVAHYRTIHPGVTVRLRAGLLDDLLRGLDSGDLDLVLSPLREDVPGRYRRRPLSDEDVVLVTPPDDPPPHGDLAAYRDRTFVCLPQGSGLSRVLVRAAARRGFVPRVDLEASTTQDVRALVSAGLGVALLPESELRKPGPPVQVCGVEPHAGHPPIGVIARTTTPSPAAAAFEAMLVADVAAAVRARDAGSRGADARPTP